MPPSISISNKHVWLWNRRRCCETWQQQQHKWESETNKQRRAVNLAAPTQSGMRWTNIFQEREMLLSVDCVWMLAVYANFSRVFLLEKKKKRLQMNEWPRRNPNTARKSQSVRRNRFGDYKYTQTNVRENRMSTATTTAAANDNHAIVQWTNGHKYLWRVVWNHHLALALFQQECEWVREDDVLKKR